MAIQSGSNEITNVQVGSTPITAVYSGATLVWPVAGWKTVWESETIYELMATPTGEASTSTRSGYLSTITNPITTGLIKAGKQIRITLASYSATITRRYSYAGETYAYSMATSSRPTQTTYEFEIPTTTGSTYFNLRINSDNSSAYVTRIYFDVQSDGTANLRFYGTALSGDGLKGKCYGPAVKITKIEQLL